MPMRKRMPLLSSLLGASLICLVIARALPWGDLIFDRMEEEPARTTATGEPASHDAHDPASGDSPAAAVPAVAEVHPSRAHAKGDVKQSLKKAGARIKHLLSGS